MLVTIKRLSVNLIVTLLVLEIAAAILPDFQLRNVLAAVLGLGVISVLNSAVRPTLVRLTLPLTVLSFGGFAVVLNGLIILVAGSIVPGFHVGDLVTAILISFALAIANMVVTSSILTNADQELHEYHVIQRFARKVRLSSEQRHQPGLILIEIDGLSEPVLRKAIATGVMPTLASWLGSGSYRLIGWESGLPAQTSAMQAGILHGSHFNIPAFRFYDKPNQRLLVSGHPADAMVMLKGVANGKGLLHENGFCVNNWAHGDAPDVVLTMSTLALQVRSAVAQSEDLFGYFASAYNLQRAIIKTFVDVVVEIWEAWEQRRHNVLPRVERRFPYPFVRALTTALLPDISCYLLIQKMFEGVEVAYSTLVNYDEVAHHSGIDRPDTRRVLRQLDGQIRWVTKAGEYAPRRYDVVVLSDHGQSQGATFKQRHGQSLAELVTSLMPEEYAAAPERHHDEGIDWINVLVTQLARADHLRSRLLQWMFRHHTADGIVDVRKHAKSEGTRDHRTVVCASGNLGLIYFTEWPERVTLEQIESRFPDLVDGLVHHPGIGFLMVQTEADGPVVLGTSGRCRLRDGVVEGQDPLAPYGPRAVDHLRNVSAYPNQGDLVVNSLYDPETGEVAAFEELVGSHGGLGSTQNRPFLFYPAHLDSAGPAKELVGAPAIYDILQEWRKRATTAPI